MTNPRFLPLESRQSIDHAVVTIEQVLADKSVPWTRMVLAQAVANFLGPRPDRQLEWHKLNEQVEELLQAEDHAYEHGDR